MPQDSEDLNPDLRVRKQKQESTHCRVSPKALTTAAERGRLCCALRQPLAELAATSRRWRFAALLLPAARKDVSFLSVASFVPVFVRWLDAF